MRRLAFAVLLALVACDSQRVNYSGESPSASATFAATEGTAAFGDPASLGFDLQGDLWFGNYESSTVARYDDVGTSGVPKAADVIAGTAIKGPNAMVFDAHGWMWVPMYDNGTVVGFSHDDLAAGRGPTVVYAPGGGLLVQPGGVALDKDGNLWVANASAGYLVRFPRAGLEAGTAKPDVVLTVPDEKCQGVLVDREGNVWQSCFGTDRLYVYAAASAAKTGAPKPVRTVTWEPAQPCGPTLMTLGPTGQVWVACYEPGAAVALGADASGRAAEEVRITGPELEGLHGIAFDPAGRLWLGTNLNAVLRVDDLTSGPVKPAVVLRSR